ncbi:hypothetical protein AJ78_01787 [Emergomyces pasteurianus Ep9510]|uniref:F-box domain-containing protein n=1 Tax=Emergomyces pasteurianus Ep9510 TaxID=1447872 RepID=A0A1J9QPS7_9EURO|nr:hypothetical protein AJ78_01787 [Emergomyces pasteurianus Ep9510]
MTEKHTLQLLPGEILQLIHSFLSPGSKLTLSMTCKRFYDSFFETIPASCMYDPVRRRELEAAGRDSPYMDELEIYDVYRGRELCGFKSKRQLFCCDSCLMRHFRLFFHPDKLDKPVTERGCIKHTRGFWIEPGKCFSFGDLIVPGRPARIDKMQTPRAIAVSEDNSNARRYLLWTHYDILTLPMHKRASKKQIAKILSGFDLPTCPHIRLSDSVIMEHCDIPRHTITEPLNQRSSPFFDPVDLRPKCTFPSCLTSFCWTEHASTETPGWKTVYLHVLRKLRLNTAVDRTWVVQLMNPSEAPLLERHWNDCFRWKIEILAIEKEKYENEASDEVDARSGGGVGGGCNEDRDGAKHATELLAREALLRQREDIVNTLFHPRRLRNYPDIIRRLEGMDNNLSITNNNNNPNTTSSSARRTWTPPTTAIVTSERTRETDSSIKSILKKQSEAVLLRPFLPTPFFTEEDFERQFRREWGETPVHAQGQKKPTSLIGRLFNATF